MFKNTFVSAIAFLCISAIFCPKGLAQIGRGGTPFSFSARLGEHYSTVVMKPVDNDSLIRADRKYTADQPTPFRYGFVHEVDLGLETSGTWTTLSGGAKVWRLKITSPGAYSLSLIFNKFHMPPGGQLFLYDPERTIVLGAFTSENNKAHGKFSTSPINGSSVIIEYYEPANAASAGILNISRVIHAYRDVFNKSYGDSGNCNVNANCSIASDWRNEKRSVAMILDSGGRFCTGAIVNNENLDNTPYFLTANHCLGTDVSTWVFMFNYESSGCTSSDGRTDQTISGATLLANNASSDFALLQLSSVPPESYSTYFAGWSRVNTASQTSVAIHHPQGDIKKYSKDNDTVVSSAYLDGNGLANSHWKVVDWDTGTTESGSSGSPLFDQNHRIVGQLHGGYAQCGNNQSDWYGKFSMSWDYGTSASTRLKDWLDPDNTGLTTLDGKWGPTPPPTATIDGPSFINVGVQGTWYARVAGGEPPYSYYWETYWECEQFAGAQIMGPTCGIWGGGETGETWTYTPIDETDFRLRLTVTDAKNRSDVSPVQYVTVSSGAGKNGTLADSENTAATSTFPAEFTLEGNYPNPFNPITTIRFGLPEPAHVKLVIYNMLGNEVARLRDNKMNGGFHSVEWDARDYPSGVYIYKLQAGANVDLSRMVLLK